MVEDTLDKKCPFCGADPWSLHSPDCGIFSAATDQQVRNARANSKADSYQVGGSHYQGEYTQQHWDYCWERKFNQFQYVITKYVERYPKKNGLEDLLKARQYLDKLIELEYPDHK